MRNATWVEPGTPSTTSRCDPIVPAAALDFLVLLPANENSSAALSEAFSCVQVTTRMVLVFGCTVTTTLLTKSSPFATAVPPEPAAAPPPEPATRPPPEPAMPPPPEPAAACPPPASGGLPPPAAVQSAHSQAATNRND